MARMARCGLLLALLCVVGAWCGMAHASETAEAAQQILPPGGFTIPLSPALLCKEYTTCKRCVADKKNKCAWCVGTKSCGAPGHLRCDKELARVCPINRVDAPPGDKPVWPSVDCGDSFTHRVLQPKSWPEYDPKRDKETRNQYKKSKSPHKRAVSRI